jgi:site-specific DNA recombinase
VERRTAPVEAQGESLRAEALFRADGSRGATLNRPGVDRWRARLKEATLARGVLARSDRLARHYVHPMVLWEECAQAGCQVEFRDQPLGQAPQAQLLWHIRGAVAAYERTFMADRRRRGRQMQLRAGMLLPWTLPPSGDRLHPERPRDPAGGPIEPTAGAIGHA